MEKAECLLLREKGHDFGYSCRVFDPYVFCRDSGSEVLRHFIGKNRYLVRKVSNNRCVIRRLF